MNGEDFSKHIVEPTVEELKRLMMVKGGEYAGDGDRLANFKRNAERLGLKPEQVWAVYFAKHLDAIFQHVHDLQTGKTRPASEPLEGRVDDAINYLILFKGLLWERRNAA